MKESANHPVIFDHKKEFEALGTKNQIMIYGSHSEGLLQRAINRVMEIDDKMSAFKPDSEISNINQNAGKNKVSISKETLELFDIAKKMSELSKGAFDITIGPLVRLWGIGKRGSFIPTASEIEECLRLIHYQDLLIDREHNTSYLRNAGQAVDLGGIAKGYAADEVKRILIQGGVNCAVINLGGNIVTIGPKPDGNPWRIGIQNPLAPTGEYLGSVSVTDRTIVTSGSNERFFIKDGIRYHHLLDPRTGRPAKSGLLSVTVICGNSAEADALTTALFILGMEQGLPLLNHFQAEAVFLTEDGRIYVTDGLKNNYQNKVNDQAS